METHFHIKSYFGFFIFLLFSSFATTFLNAEGNAVPTSPSNNSSLASSSVTFNWNDVGADQYGIRVGTGITVETDNIYFDGVTTGTSLVVNNLPEDGSALYVKLLQIMAVPGHLSSIH